MKGNKKSIMNKVLSMILAVLMLVTSVPVDVHAAEPSLIITNGKGEVSDTFYVGEPIYVTASSDTARAWVGVYENGYEANGTSYTYWYYVNEDGYQNGNTYNIYHTNTWEGGEPSESGRSLPTGKCIIALHGTDLKKELTIKEKDANAPEAGITVSDTSVETGEKITINTTSYVNGSWIAIYKGEVTNFDDSYGNNWQYTVGYNGTNGGYDWSPLAEGKYTIALYEGNTVVDSIVVEAQGEEVEVLSTDKTSYKFGEPIMVSLNYSTANDTWVGLFRKGDTPGGANQQAFYWNYLRNISSTFNMIDNSNKENLPSERWAQYVAGEYTIILFKDGGYNVAASVDITITKEELGRETTNPTCEEDGKIVITYSDDTTETITAAEDSSLNALGHDYDADDNGKDDWSYNGVENKTHTKTCSVCMGENGCADCENATVTEACTFDEGVVTEEPTANANGIKTYTCSECGGTYTEEISAKVPVGTDIIKPATCEKEGVLRTYFDEVGGNDYIDTPISPLGHDYDADDDGEDDWAHVDGSEIHQKACVNCAAVEGCSDCENAVITEACDYGTSLSVNVAENKITSVCGVCGYEKVEPILFVEEEINYGDPINVTLNSKWKGSSAWVGLYRKGDTPGVPYQEAFYWNYLSALSSPFNMIASSNRAEGLSSQRWAQYVAGEYTIILFADGGYTVATSVDITITKEETSRNKIEPTCENDGKIVITYSDNTTETITAEQDETLAALGHAYPEEWTFDKENKKHTKVCQNEEDKCNEAVRTLTESCTFGEPEITKEPVGLELGEKKFTCSVCKGSYTESFTDKTIIGEEIIEPATCEKNGVKRYYYEGGYFDVTIDMIGHSYSECKHIEGTKTHSQTCVNDATHIVINDCEYGKPVVRDNSVIYTCKECNGEYVTSILTSDKTVYDIDDPINITAFCENKGSWVGLYKKGDKYGEGAGTIFSMRWYYVVNDGIDRNGATIDISSSAYIGDRQDPIVAGDYYVVLFSDGGYDEIARVEFSIVGDTTETEYTLDINGKVYDTGAKLYFEENDDIKLTISAEGSLGESWVGVYTNEMGIDTDFTNITSAYWQWLKDIKGEPLNLKNEMTLLPGDYSIVIFSDGGKSNPRKIVNFSIAQNENDANIIKQPTCDDWGSKYVEYENGTTAYVPIEPLGHDVKEWTYNKEDHVHFGTCQRTGCGKKITENCQFDDGILIEENEDGSKAVLYTCETCKGTYTEGYTEALPFTESVVRIFGKNRIKTAMLVADQYKELMNAESFDNVIIASGDNFADALSGTYLAKEKNAPILMYQKRYANDLCEYITANLDKDGTIYILGGVAAIPEELDESLKEFEVKRLAGDNRYDTNLKILKEAGVKGEKILVCTGKDFADGLSASAVGKPILLVNNRTNKLSDEQKELLKSLSVKNFYIIGGENAVDEAYEVELSYYGATERIGGRTRYETSVMIAERFFDNPEVAVLAYAKNFPDGLCGGPLAMALNAPLILTATNKTTNAEAYLNNYDITGGIVLGGDGLISDDSVNNIFDMQENDEIIVVQ